MYELFTLGLGNGYTQTDITETAKALTGFTQMSEMCGNITFNPADHDEGVKTIFGQTGNWGYDDVLDILFEQRGSLVAAHITRKIYEFFVGPNPEEGVINELASTLLANNFDVIPVLELLFKSELFFDDDVMGNLIKYPTDLAIQFWNELAIPVNDQVFLDVFNECKIIGEFFFNPPDVSGYPNGLEWVNSSTLAGRWGMMSKFVDHVEMVHPQFLSAFAQGIVPDQSVWTDPHAITAQIVDHFIPRGLQEQAHYDSATVVFKADVPQNYFDIGEWNLGWWPTTDEQVALLLKYIFKLPEFQLG